MESGRKGDYFVWDMKLADEVSNIALYNEAKAFALSVEQNNVDVKYEQDSPSTSKTEASSAPPTAKVESTGAQEKMPF